MTSVAAIRTRQNLGTFFNSTRKRVARVSAQPSAAAVIAARPRFCACSIRWIRRQCCFARRPSSRREVPVGRRRRRKLCQWPVNRIEGGHSGALFIVDWPQNGDIGNQAPRCGWISSTGPHASRASRYQNRPAADTIPGSNGACAQTLRPQREHALTVDHIWSVEASAADSTRGTGFGVPRGIRTPVTAVKGRCPRPG